MVSISTSQQEGLGSNPIWVLSKWRFHVLLVDVWGFPFPYNTKTCYIVYWWTLIVPNHACETVYSCAALRQTGDLSPYYPMTHPTPHPPKKKDLEGLENWWISDRSITSALYFKIPEVLLEKNIQPWVRPLHNQRVDHKNRLLESRLLCAEDAVIIPKKMQTPSVSELIQFWKKRDAPSEYRFGKSVWSD